MLVLEGGEKKKEVHRVVDRHLGGCRIKELSLENIQEFEFESTQIKSTQYKCITKERGEQSN